MNLEKKLKKNFKGIYKACGNKFLFTCGSYLINGYKYKYDKRMLAKQLLLYDLAKKKFSYFRSWRLHGSLNFNNAVIKS